MIGPIGRRAVGVECSNLTLFPPSSKHLNYTECSEQFMYIEDIYAEIEATWLSATPKHPAKFSKDV
ncbi:hypothetical protein ACTXT7_007491 [Hymenolepis weldensis]